MRTIMLLLLQFIATVLIWGVALIAAIRTNGWVSASLPVGEIFVGVVLLYLVMRVVQDFLPKRPKPDFIPALVAGVIVFAMLVVAPWFFMFLVRLTI